MTPGTLEQTGRRIARARAIERRWFEILGGWVTTTADADVKLCFARQSHHHAWHAELFERVLPSANGFATDVLTDALPTAWDDLLADVAASASTADRLAGAYGVVLPAMLEEYEHWRDGIDPVRDAPLLRWLRFVIIDEVADLHEGRTLLGARTDAELAPGRARGEAALARAGALLA